MSAWHQTAHACAVQVRERMPQAGAALQVLQGSGRAAAVAPKGWTPAVGDEVAVLSMPAAATGRVLSLASGGKGKTTVKARIVHRMHDSIVREGHVQA